MRSKNPRLIWSDEIAQRFLDALRRLKSPEKACADTGIPKSTAYVYRRGDANFRAAWGAAVAGKPAPMADIITKGLTEIVADPNASPEIKLRASRELRLAQRFGDRDEDDDEEIVLPPTVRAAKTAGRAGPPLEHIVAVIDNANKEASVLLLLNAEIHAAHNMNLRVDREEWERFGQQELGYQLDVLALLQARNPDEIRDRTIARVETIVASKRAES